MNTVMGVADGEAETSRQPSTGGSPDWPAIGTYLAGTLAQIGVMVLWLYVLGQFSESLSAPWSTGAAIAFFTLLAIRSRLFSPLNNARTRNTYTSVQRPAWAPPPLAFPVIWMGIAVLRVAASYLVWQQLGADYLSWPLVLFVIHLALGDTWNTIFTVEGRLGAAVPAVLLGPLASACVVAWSYGQAEPLAGWLLVPMVLWLAVASALVLSIWSLNGAEPWYPLKQD